MGMPEMQDRRKKHRFEINLPLILRKLDSLSVVHAVTFDLSVSGFSCLVSQPFSPGDRFDCLIQLPEGSDSGPKRYISGRAELVRVGLGSRGYLIGCVIQEQTIIDSEALPSWATTPFARAASAQTSI